MGDEPSEPGSPTAAEGQHELRLDELDPAAHQLWLDPRYTHTWLGEERRQIFKVGQLGGAAGRATTGEGRTRAQRALEPVGREGGRERRGQEEGRPPSV